MNELLAELPEQSKTVRLMVGGGKPPIVLHRTYDPQQAWLPFVDSVIFPVHVSQLLGEEPRPLAERHFESVPALRSKQQKRYAALPEINRHLYVYEPGQHVLPFREGRRVSHKDWARLTHAGFPGWDLVRDKTGAFKPIEVEVHHKRTRDAQEWLEKTARHRYHMWRSNIYVHFENATEAAVFKMQFGREWNA